MNIQAANIDTLTFSGSRTVKNKRRAEKRELIGQQQANNRAKRHAKLMALIGYETSEASSLKILEKNKIVQGDLRRYRQQIERELGLPKNALHHNAKVLRGYESAGEIGRLKGWREILLLAQKLGQRTPPTNLNTHQVVSLQYLLGSLDNYQSGKHQTIGKNVGCDVAKSWIKYLQAAGITDVDHSLAQGGIDRLPGIMGLIYRYYDELGPTYKYINQVHRTNYRDIHPTAA